MTIRTVSRLVTGAGLALCALLAGCRGPIPDIDDYGVVVPLRLPTVVLTDFSYAPQSPIRIGDTLTLTATTNQPATSVRIRAYLLPTPEVIAELQDDGKPPDLTANDGRWTAELTWSTELGTVDAGSVYAMLSFDSHAYESQYQQAPPLTVLEAEEE